MKKFIFMKLLSTLLISSFNLAQAKTVNDGYSYKLLCSVSAPIYENGNLTRKVVAKQEADIIISTDGSESQNLNLEYTVGNELVKLSGTGSILDRSFDGFSLMTGSVVMKLEIPTRSLVIHDHDGLQIDMSNLGVVQGGIGSSSTTVSFSQSIEDIISFGCSIIRKKSN